MPAAPSLLIVPYRSKTGKLYSQIPTSGAGDFTVTRNTTATRFNSAGLLESVASGIPRLDYATSGGTVGCPALLVEPAATNLCLQSENFSTNWSPTNTTVSGNVTGTTDPAGGNTADQIFETATSGSHFLAQTMSITSGTTYVGSVFYKKAAGSPDWMQVAFSTTGLAGFANFNLTSGTVGNVFAGATGRIENYGNGWYRCTLIQTASASGTSGGPIIVFTNNTNSATRFVSYTGNTATSIYAWGAQLETGSVATSYIPTTAGTGSRSADVISVSGAVSGSIGQTEGTIYVDINRRDNSTPNRRILSIGTGSNFDNRIEIVCGGTGNANKITCAMATSGVTQFSQQSSVDFLGDVKAALSYSSAGFSFYVNGNVIASGTTAITPPIVNSIGLGQIWNTAILSNVAFNDRIRAVALYTTRLTDAELATLTTP